MMKVFHYKFIIPLVVLFTVITGCDSMFETWFDTPAEERDVKWKLVDGPMESISDPYSDASTCWLGIRDDKLFVAWVSNGMINFYRYNGDDDNPAWTFESGFAPSSPDSLAFCSYNNALVYAYFSGTAIYVMDTSGSYYGGMVVDSGLTGPLNLVVSGGQLCLFWYDGVYTHLYMYNSALGLWNDINDVYGYGINNIDGDVNRVRATVVDGNLYTAFIVDADGSTILNDYMKVRRYDSSGWVTIWEELNFSPGLGYANYPDIAGYKGQAVVSWIETYTDNRLCVRKANNGEWLDGGYGNYPGLIWTHDATTYVQMTSFTKVNGNLCLMWIEDVNDAIYGYYQGLRISVYNGDSKDYLPWTDITGSRGLNIQPGSSITGAYSIEYDDKLYVAFLEMNTSGWNALHVKVGH